MELKELLDSFEEIEVVKEYDGYHYNVMDAIKIVILGSLCGLKNVNQIHQWATTEHIKEFLSQEFNIKKIPCYYWLLCLLKLVTPESLNKCFMYITQRIIYEYTNTKDLTLAVDGKTIRSTAHMDSYESPLHIVTAQISEFGLSFAQKTVEGKSNEIPAVQELLNEINIKGFTIVCDAMHCQKNTAKIIVNQKGNYLFSVKDNQARLKKDIEEYVHDKELQKQMDFISKVEKNRGRIEKRSAFVTNDINWIENKNEWADLKCIGAIHSEFTLKNKKTEQWHYYISNRNLSADELLTTARKEWTVETMHWLLDVHFKEDFCRVIDKNIQQNLNMMRKLSFNFIKRYKEKLSIKLPISRIMFACLMTPTKLIEVFKN